MIFERNTGKQAVFSAVFNKLAYAPVFDVDAFHDAAAESGWREARVQKSGESMVMERSRQHDRITAQLDENGKLKRYLKG